MKPDMSGSRQFLSFTAGNYVLACKQNSFIAKHLDQVKGKELILSGDG